MTKDLDKTYEERHGLLRKDRLGTATIKETERLIAIEKLLDDDDREKIKLMVQQDDQLGKLKLLEEKVMKLQLDVRGFKLRERFNQLKTLWAEETKMLSSTTQINNNSHYRQMVALGPDIIPFVIDELRAESNHWFSLLRELTGENPIIDADRGYMDRMAKAWIKWWDERNE
jgi:hypothetical protein